MTVKGNHRIEEYFHRCSPHTDSQDFQRKLLTENEDEVGCAFTNADGIIVNESYPGSLV